jgi:RNA polymerase sigma factor (sigma-70 family)
MIVSTLSETPDEYPMNMDISDQDLLQRFAVSRDERAFGILIERHLDLIHGVAKRVTGNEDLAKEATQATFIRLAQRAALVPRHVAPVAWLHRTCRSLAVDLVRVEARRRKLEKNAVIPNLMNAPDEPQWAQMAPLIDGLIDQLRSEDREIVLLRYYQNQTHAAAGRLLGISEQAARKRAERALARLRSLLGGRGIATSASALALVLPVHAVSTPPAGLAATILNKAARSIPARLPRGVFRSLLTLTALQKFTLGAAALLLVAGIVAVAKFAGHAALDKNATLTAASGPDRKSSIRKSDEERTAQIEEWMRETGKPDSSGQIDHEIRQAIHLLPIAGLDRLVHDRELMSDQLPGRLTIDPVTGKTEYLRRYPLRWLIATQLWGRYGELAPEDALDCAFPDGPKGGFVGGNMQLPTLIIEASRGAPKRAWEIWLNHRYEHLAFHLRGPDTESEPIMDMRASNGMPTIEVDIFRNWAEQDLEGLRSEFASLSSGDRPIAYRGYARALPKDSDWTEETEQMEEWFPETYSYPATNLAARWAQADPDGAVAWLATLPGDFNQRVQETIELWLDEAPGQALDWLKNWQPPGGDRELFYKGILLGGQRIGFEEMTPMWGLNGMYLTGGGNPPRQREIAARLLDIFHDPENLKQAVTQYASWASEATLKTWMEAEEAPPQVRVIAATTLEERKAASAGTAKR